MELLRGLKTISVQNWHLFLKIAILDQDKLVKCPLSDSVISKLIDGFWGLIWDIFVEVGVG